MPGASAKRPELEVYWTSQAQQDRECWGKHDRRALIAELDGPSNAGAERAWLEEAQKRHREVVEGKVQPVPGEHIFANLRSRLER